MEAKQSTLFKLLKIAPQFEIPIYQRTYSWTEKQCEQLWSDIMRAGHDQNVHSHFIGAIVYIGNGSVPITDDSEISLLVIDGQQRLTTIFLILEALARQVGEDEPLKGFSATKLREYYLTNPLETGNEKYKLVLTQTDEATLYALIDNRDIPHDHAERLVNNFDFYVTKIADLGNDLITFCKGLQKLTVVDVALDRQQDNPQLIFESMNSTGLELSQGDLIRNYVLMGLEPKLQRELYTKHWRPMEEVFGQTGYDQDFDWFVRHYLTYKTRTIPNIRKVYESFKTFVIREFNSRPESVVAELYRFAIYYCAMAHDREKDTELKRAFSDLREIDIGVAYPLLLQIYETYEIGVISKNEFLKTVRLIENYCFRRSICQIPTNSLNKTFATFGSQIENDRFVDSVIDGFLQLSSYRRFPSDDDFKRDLISRNDLNTFSRRKYLLRKLENYKTKEPIVVESLTIEHVMPQNEEVSVDWRSELGHDWKRIHEQYLNTLGNLTLTGYNPEYSDHSFTQKVTMKNGFKESPLRLNRRIAEFPVWNETSILQRTTELAELAVDVWKRPDSTTDTRLQLTTDEVRSLKNTDAGLEIVERVRNSAIGAVFDEVNREVLKFDSCVNAIYGERSISYEAEDIFLTVEPNEATLSLRIMVNPLEHGHLLTEVPVSRLVNNQDSVTIPITNFSEFWDIRGLIEIAYENQLERTTNI